MSTIVLTVVCAIILLSILMGLLIWAISNGQWNDLETPAHRLLMEDLDER